MEVPLAPTTVATGKEGLAKKPKETMSAPSMLFEKAQQSRCMSHLNEQNTTTHSTHSGKTTFAPPWSSVLGRASTALKERMAAAETAIIC
jgi:hypothetical protein